MHNEYLQMITMSALDEKNLILHVFFLGGEPKSWRVPLPVPGERAGVPEPAGSPLRPHTESPQHSNLSNGQRALCRRLQGTVAVYSLFFSILKKI
jgi:hypothetical protein